MTNITSIHIDEEAENKILLSIKENTLVEIAKLTMQYKQDLVDTGINEQQYDAIFKALVLSL